MKNVCITIAAFLLSSLDAVATFDWGEHYTVDTVSIPKSVDPQVGGLALLPDGRVVACFHRGEVKIYDPKTKKWSLFAEGLHEPLGVHVDKAGGILVIQRPEITRLHDTDKDGTADFYEAITTDWGMSGNYHEFSFGIVEDSKGNFYVSLGTASNGSGVREEIRGAWNNVGGLSHARLLYDNTNPKESWRVKKAGIPRMYARVPYRGCILKIKPGNPKAEVYATGFRTPNGLYMDKEDRLWVADNQGDWVGACNLFRVESGEFHGHVASLLWDTKNPVVDQIPAEIPIAELDKRRVKEVCFFPQSICANSVSQIVPVDPSFVPTQNTDAMMFLGDVYSTNRFLGFYKDEVNGSVQGAACHVFKNSSVGGGNNRLLYSADGTSMYLGKTHLSWAGREGMKKVSFTGKPYLMVEKVNLTPNGFTFTFNTTIEKIGQPKDYVIQSYYLKYFSKYGSPLIDKQKEAVSLIKAEGNILTIELSEPIKKGFVYDMKLPERITSAYSDISSNHFWYTANEVYTEHK